ncbi:hypothetical protein [Brumimicrobium oceani]|uniref:Uncharacterized protein n=1 Tax=Brumimicrobium oceani TaxID=2100725 RepID=A0A2U2XB73_9FLAO|nr:hypothetical protein [Brumimicrobium oceani]PWH85013.1 hypothetical protein DIT68_11620 [Brumimicrobium oceani]
MLKTSVNFLIFILMSSFMWAQAPTQECVSFRDGFEKFPLPGKGEITLNSGETIEGEFKQGMTIKMNKWQWHGKDGNLHEIKEVDVNRVVFYPDMQFVDQDITVDVNISIGDKNLSQVVDKDLPYDIPQFSTFDKEEHYKPVILERVITDISKKGKEKSKLMVLVNNGFDAKYKVYVDLGGARQLTFGQDVTMVSMVKGGGEMGSYYDAFRVVKQGEKMSQLIKKPGMVSFLIGGFRNKEFVQLFGDNPEFMACYPKSMKRKFKYTPEFFWVYNHK